MIGKSKYNYGACCCDICKITTESLTECLCNQCRKVLDCRDYDCRYLPNAGEKGGIKDDIY